MLTKLLLVWIAHSVWCATTLHFAQEFVFTLCTLIYNLFVIILSKILKLHGSTVLCIVHFVCSRYLKWLSCSSSWIIHKLPGMILCGHKLDHFCGLLKFHNFLLKHIINETLTNSTAHNKEFTAIDRTCITYTGSICGIM